MNFSKWIKRLRREAAASPKKAAALGVIFIVALYFWAPLLKNWIAKSEPSEGSNAGSYGTDGGASVAVTPPGTAPADPTQAKDPVYAWDQWIKRIEQDPRTKVARDLADRPDPFHRVPRPAVEEVVVKKKPETVRVTATPASLAMQLTSTVVGSGPRLAVVNGKVYREGDTITVLKDSQKVEFKLAEVGVRRVVLLSQNERFELSLPARKRSGRVELSKSQP